MPAADLARSVGPFTRRRPVRVEVPRDVPLDPAEPAATALPAAVKRVKELLRAATRDDGPYPVEAPSLGFRYHPPLAGRLLADPDAPPPCALTAVATVRNTARGPRLTLAVERDPARVTGEWVREVSDAWARALRAVAACAGVPGAGGRTPSDLPLVSLTQGEITRLEAAVPDLTDVVPLSPLQRGLLFHAVLDVRALAVYSSQTVFGFAGALDAAALREAARRLLARHDNLRAGFWREGPNRCSSCWRAPSRRGARST